LTRAPGQWQPCMLLFEGTMVIWILLRQWYMDHQQPIKYAIIFIAKQIAVFKNTGTGWLNNTVLVSLLWRMTHDSMWGFNTTNQSDAFDITDWPIRSVLSHWEHNNKLCTHVNLKLANVCNMLSIKWIKYNMCSTS
jgi:hypothetical protein